MGTVGAKVLRQEAGGRLEGGQRPASGRGVGLPGQRWRTGWGLVSPGLAGPYRRADWTFFRGAREPLKISSGSGVIRFAFSKVTLTAGQRVEYRE